MKPASLALILAAGWILTSCGTGITMTEYLPATVNLTRNSTVSLAYADAYSEALAECLFLKIRNDGYYQAINGSVPNPDYSISMGGSYSKPNYIHVIIQYGHNGSVIYDGHIYMSSPESVAEEIYHIIAPHEQEYTVRVSASSDNPELQKAIATCEVRNWDRARELTLEAISKHPQDPEGYYLLALLERNQSHYAQSNDLLQKAIELDPGKGRYKAAVKRNAVLQTNEANVIQQLSH